MTSPREGLPLVIVGGDGMDAILTEKWMAAGHLPSLARISSEGGYGRLHTTCPAESPVAWSTFATGLNPGRHGIFGFLHRDPHTYLPRVSMVTLRDDEAEGHREGTPFWDFVGREGFRVALLRVPLTFPPESVNGVAVSGLGMPDLLMSWGTSSLYTTEPGKRREHRVQVEWSDTSITTSVRGPGGSTISLHLTRAPRSETLTVELEGTHLTLRPREWSSWTPLVFSRGSQKWHGICRFCLLSLKPHLRLYLSPIHQHPLRPLYPFTYPTSLARTLVDAMGLFPTLGWAEDVTGLNAGHLDEDAFLEQAYYMLDEQERVTFWALEGKSPDLLISVTEVTDRIAHVFMGRDRDDEWSGAVLECYQRFDAFVGRLVAAAGPDATVIVLSDHGFAPVHHVVHLNSWLRDSGYLVLHESENRPLRIRPFWPDVDWRSTRAYALGLSHIYVNQRGRERLGCVEPGGEYARLCREIAARLVQLRDPESGESVVSRVLLRDELYSGPCIDRSGDLVVAFRRGYRTSEQTAVGGIPTQVVVPNRRRAWSADHCSVDPEEVPGVLFCNRPLSFAGARLIDIAPTVLDLLGVSVPKGLEGRSLVP